MVTPLWPFPSLPPLPSGLVLPAPPRDAVSDGAFLADSLQRSEKLLGRLEELLALGIVTREDVVKVALTTPTVTVGTESEFEVEFKDLLDKPVKFVHLTITEVDIAAPQLANADDVRLRLFRQSRRRVPQDLLAEFTGSSVVSGTWVANFSNRRIEYTDVSGRSKLYIAIRNTAGNSGPTTFDLRFYARAFPIRA